MADTADAHAANARERAWRLRRAEMTRHPLATILRANALERSAATDRADAGIAAVRCDGWIGRWCVCELVGRGDASFVKAREFVDVAVVRESNVVREW